MPESKSLHMTSLTMRLCCLVIAAVFFSMTAIMSSNVLASTVVNDPLTSESGQDQEFAVSQPKIDLSSVSALVIETGRMRSLYNLNNTTRMNIPTASKIMTAMIACERLPLDTPVTISKVAAAAEPKAGTPDGVSLKAGDKYLLNYLLYRLICYNSDSAALAIAELIANVEEDFVILMNARANQLSMTDTLFANSTGNPANNEFVILQYTTLSDLVELVYQAISNPEFNKILTSSRIFISLDGKTQVTMYNEMQSLFIRSDGQIKGAFYCESENASYMIAVGTANNINIIAATAVGNPQQRNNDLLALFEGCASFYESTPLVSAGQLLIDRSEQTIDGEFFGLMFKQTVYYVHPIDDQFVKPTTTYKSFGPFSRPIQFSLRAGQVIFELNDGTEIPVDVGPSRQILSSITLLDKALSDLQSNSNLTFVLILSAAVLLLIILIQVLLGLKRLFHLTSLIIHEKRSRR